MKRIQNSLGGFQIPLEQNTQLNNTFLMFGRVIAVNTAVQKVFIATPIGTDWAKIMKPKASRRASTYDMPNIGDIAIVSVINGHSQNLIVLGFIEDGDPLNTILTDSNRETGTVEQIKDKLMHRFYWKHETGSSVLLKKLGNLLMRLYKKASLETDPAKKNIEVSLDNNGNLVVTLYKADGSTTSVSITGDAAGNLNIKTDMQVILESPTVITKGTTELNNESAVNAGVITGQSIDPFTGLPHIDFSTSVRAKK